MACRECSKEVSSQTLTCPHCGAPQPAQQDWKGTGLDWRTEATYLGYPLIHIAYGRDEHGKRRVAKGVIAIGQYAIGAVTVAQFGVGLLFGFGQFMIGLTSVAQFAIAAVVGIGQFATGYVAIGQIAAGYYVLAQFGLAEHLWDTQQRDAEAAEFFEGLWESLRPYLMP